MKPKLKPTIDQKFLWNDTFIGSQEFFGEKPSQFAEASLELFQKNDVHSLLELGCGQGRDSFLFAGNNIDVIGLDYSESAVAGTRDKAEKTGLASCLRTQVQDLRERLPFDNESFDACYSHMLLCMELSTDEIAFIMCETHRILKPGGLAVYSVRSSFDKHYQTGSHRSEDIYEIDSFIVHFYTAEKILQLAKGFEIQKVERMEEGSLPRDLFCVTLKKGPVPETWNLDPCEEMAMSDPLQDFMDTVLTPGPLGHKTKATKLNSVAPDKATPELIPGKT